MASKRFVRLEREVEHEYRKKGMNLARARRIGRAVAGEVATKKHWRGGKPMAFGKGHPRDCDCAFCRRADRLHRARHRHHHHRRHHRKERR